MSEQPVEHVPGQIDLPGVLPNVRPPDEEELRAAFSGLSPEQRENLAELLEDTIEAVRQEKERKQERGRLSSLELVKECVHRNDVAQSDLERAVRRARSYGATWEQIGAAAGTSRQGAWKRWSSPTDHEHTATPEGRCSYCNADLR